MKDKRESSEDYLEAILMLEKERKSARAVDVANRLGFSKPSVSIALKKLHEEGLILPEEPGSSITLTPKGRKIAEKTLERHDFLTGWFVSLGVDPKIAEQDACRIEHDLSDETWAAIKEHSRSRKR